MGAAELVHRVRSILNEMDIGMKVRVGLATGEIGVSVVGSNPATLSYVDSYQERGALHKSDQLSRVHARGGVAAGELIVDMKCLASALKADPMLGLSILPATRDSSVELNGYLAESRGINWRSLLARQSLTTDGAYAMSLAEMQHNAFLVVRRAAGRLVVEDALNLGLPGPQWQQVVKAMIQAILDGSHSEENVSTWLQNSFSKHVSEHEY